MSYAACNPEEAYAGSQEEGLTQYGKIYISPGASLVITDNTTISGAEVILTNATNIKKSKTKHLKKITEKPKAGKKTTAPSQPIFRTPIETISPNDSKHTWGANTPYNKQVSIPPNISFKYVAVAIDAIFINVILISIALLTAVYQRHILNKLLFGRNFQRPPPTIS